MGLAHRAANFDSVYPGHNDIEKHCVELCCIRQCQGLFPGARLDYRIAITGKYDPQRVPHLSLVIDDKHRAKIAVHLHLLPSCGSERKKAAFSFALLTTRA
jgi:hypothetical protein